jgi:peroxiredoxin Q/BCP
MKAIALLSSLLLILLCSCNETDSESSNGSGQGASKPGGVQIGEQAPQFSLHGYPSLEFDLSDYQGVNTVVLYFYPKDNTPDCITEACSFRDTAAEFSRREAMIVGVSSDNLASHELFADEYSLPFPLLADIGGKVRRLYGNPDGSKSLISRITYVIDKQGIVREIISGREVEKLQDHISRSLAAATQLAGQDDSG